jgi:hypothetical protein
MTGEPQMQFIDVRCSLATMTIACLATMRSTLRHGTPPLDPAFQQKSPITTIRGMPGAAAGKAVLAKRLTKEATKRFWRENRCG